jgi:hypothetical protein
MKMSERVNVLKPEELSAIVNAKNRAILAAQTAEKTVAEAKVAELEHRSTVQHIFLTNRLDITCKINEETGTVTWPQTEEKEGE